MEVEIMEKTEVIIRLAKSSDAEDLQSLNDLFNA
jgi:hypothetical protein